MPEIFPALFHRTMETRRNVAATRHEETKARIRIFCTVAHRVCMIRPFSRAQMFRTFVISILPAHAEIALNYHRCKNENANALYKVTLLSRYQPFGFAFAKNSEMIFAQCARELE